jgi:serine/threonine protein kinase/tetratricopeptide (TPR) repeat protein
MIGKTISHYKILEELGRGGMGVVYKAEDLNLGRTVAIKFLPPHLSRDEEAISRFIHEAKAASALDHTNIGTLYEVDRTADGETYIVMAYYGEITLRSLIDGGGVSVEEAMSITTQVAAGLAEAHGKDIVHRDIKPSNIIITKDREAKIIDFGLAKLKGKTKLTQEGSTIGTAAYMSPEQAKGEDVDHRSDIFSLGCILYELLTGAPPFRGEHDAALLYEIVHEEPKPLPEHKPDLPKDLQRIVDRALEKDPHDRYQSAEDMLEDLEKLKAGVSAGASSGAAHKRSLRFIPLYIPLTIIIILITYFAFTRFITPRPGKARTIRIAVLPFENLGAPEDEYFADGITEEITARLANVHELSVIARTSAMQYKDTDKGIGQIGEELGVDHILEGTIRWQRLPGGGSQVRVTPQLIRVSDASHLWAQIYQEDLSDIFEVQAGIAKQVVEALNISLLEPERRAIEARPTDNMDAYQAYLKGSEYSWALTHREENFQIAIQLYERALDLDPEFAQSYAQLSMIHAYLYHEAYDRSGERLAMAKEIADRALELNPDIPESQAALGFYYYHGLKEYEKAHEIFSAANERFPNNGLILMSLGLIYRRLGDFERSVHYLERSFELSPRDARILNDIVADYNYLRMYEKALRVGARSVSLAPDQNIALLRTANTYCLYTGDLKAARAQLEKILEARGALTNYYWIMQELYERDYTKALKRISRQSVEVCIEEMIFIPKSLYLGWIYDLMGEPELARASYQEARKFLETKVLERPDDAPIRSSLGLAYAGLDMKEEAMREGEKALELIPVDKDALAAPFYVYDLSLSYTMVGEYDKALDQIERLLSIPALFSVHTLRLDPRFDPLRDHPRYKKIMDEYSGDVKRSFALHIIASNVKDLVIVARDLRNAPSHYELTSISSGSGHAFLMPIFSPILRSTDPTSCRIT